jgi:hypothetical protein
MIEKRQKALQAMQKSMEMLAADSNKILSTLKTLTAKQKNSVIALMAITRAAGIYETYFQKKDDVALHALYTPLSRFSPAYSAPGKFQAFTDQYFEATVACLGATKECEEGKHPSGYDCDSDPKVMVPCINMFLIFMREFQKLHQGIPDILDGKDPWPPQPFPY